MKQVPVHPPLEMFSGARCTWVWNRHNLKIFINTCFNLFIAYFFNQAKLTHKPTSDNYNNTCTVYRTIQYTYAYPAYQQEISSYIIDGHSYISAKSQHLPSLIIKQNILLFRYFPYLVGCYSFKWTGLFLFSLANYTDPARISPRIINQMRGQNSRWIRPNAF